MALVGFMSVALLFLQEARPAEPATAPTASVPAPTAATPPPAPAQGGPPRTTPAPDAAGGRLAVLVTVSAGAKVFGSLLIAGAGAGWAWRDVTVAVLARYQPPAQRSRRAF